MPDHCCQFLRHTFRDSIYTKPWYTEFIICILLDTGRSLYKKALAIDICINKCMHAQFSSSLPIMIIIILGVCLLACFANLKVSLCCLYFHFLTFGEHKHHFSIYLLVICSFFSRNCPYFSEYFSFINFWSSYYVMD